MSHIGSTGISVDQYTPLHHIEFILLQVLLHRGDQGIQIIWSELGFHLVEFHDESLESSALDSVGGAYRLADDWVKSSFFSALVSE